MNQYFSQNVGKNVGKQDIFLLHGLGGAGKTQVALKFIEESVAQFADIFLIDASTVETIDASLKNIATTKSIGDSSQEALQWLKSKKYEWLLLFDNADDPKIDLNNYFPQCNHGNILIMSRNPGLSVYAGEHCVISDMEETDAVDLLLRSVALHTTDHNKEIAAQVLYYLPLAIIQAGAFISKSGNLDSYLSLYAHSRAQLLTQRPTQSHDNYACTVYTKWQISFNWLSHLAKTFLLLCSSLHYQGISENLFKNATNFRLGPADPSTEELEMALKVLAQFLGPSGVWDPLYFMEVANKVRGYSLIDFDSERKMFSIHPLVQDWTRSILSDQLHHRCMIAIAGMSITKLSEEDLKWDSLELLSHIDVLLKDDSKVVPDFSHQFGKVYVLAGKPEKAQELEVKVLEKRRTLLGDNHPDTLEAMYWLGWTYQDTGKLKEAEKIGDVVLKKRRDVLGDEHPDTLDAMSNLANIYSSLGKLREAEEFHMVLLQKQKDHLGDNHLATLTTMGNLALTQRRMGKLEEAKELGLIVLGKRRSILGDNHPVTLLAQGNLAVVYQKLGRFEDAEVLESSVLEKRRNILGNSHPDTLLAMGNLATTYNDLGRLQEAEELQVRVLEKRKNIQGSNHPDTLRGMVSLASTFNKLGRLQEAEELLVEALIKRTDVLGDNHPDTVQTVQDLVVTYRGLGKLEEAEALTVGLKKRQA
ncbi:hypothetical protein FB451DRAFT_1035876 [Mycena latifolia]|nr:hypothetical protein FB451DRAFT_1035876 [Mycena latifolia]